MPKILHFVFFLVVVVVVVAVDVVFCIDWPMPESILDSSSPLDRFLEARKRPKRPKKVKTLGSSWK